MWRMRTVWIVWCVRTFVQYESRSTCERVMDENCVNSLVCSYLRPIWEQVNVWTCEGWELCESSGVFVPSSSESRSTCERVKDENCVNSLVCSYLRLLRAGERVKDENCVNRPMCSFLHPLRAGRCVNVWRMRTVWIVRCVCTFVRWEQVNVWTCEGWELCESSGVFVPSSSESSSMCERVMDENCVNRLVCSYLRPLRAGRRVNVWRMRTVWFVRCVRTFVLWEQVDVWTCEGWELCESSGVFIPSSSESRPAARVSAPSCSVRQSTWLWEDDFSRQRWTRWTVDVDARLPLPRQRRKFMDFKFTDEFTLWRPLLPYGYSYRTSCARPG